MDALFGSLSRFLAVFREVLSDTFTRSRAGGLLMVPRADGFTRRVALSRRSSLLMLGRLVWCRVLRDVHAVNVRPRSSMTSLDRHVQECFLAFSQVQRGGRVRHPAPAVSRVWRFDVHDNCDCLSLTAFLDGNSSHDLLQIGVRRQVGRSCCPKRQ